MNPHQRWTQTDIFDLRGRVERGEQIDDVAEATGRLAPDVKAMAARLRLRVKAA